MDIKTPEKDDKLSVPSAKKPYEAPVLKEWGTLKDITLAVGSSRQADGGRGPRSRTGP